MNNISLVENIKVTLFFRLNVVGCAKVKAKF